MESRGRASAASSSSFCPACNEPIDALRAGQVAILDGAFRYFCDAACKNAYVDAVSKRPSLDAMTAEPPPVASAARSAQPPIVSSGVREQSPRKVADEVRTTREAQAAPSAPSGPFFPPVASAAAIAGDDDADLAADDELTPPPPSVRMVSHATELDGPLARETTSSVEIDHEPDVDHDQASPSTLRSPSVTEAEPGVPASEPASSRRAQAADAAPRFVAKHLVAVAPVAGVIAGVLASVVSLAGEPAGILRLPLALVAAFMVVAHRLMGVVLGQREQSGPAPWVVVVPIGAASAVAAVSAVFHHPHADGHATFVGLAAASALTVDILFLRARRDVLAARARTNRALAVTARVVRGDGVVELDASLVKPGEQVIVEAGETIPVDGIVVAAGEAEVAPWLDSPALVQKTDGDAVVAGAVVVSGRLRVNATFSGAERAWLRLTQCAPSRSDSAGHVSWSPTGGRAIENSAPLVAFVRRSVDRGALLGAVVVAGAVYADNGSWLDVVIAACAGGYALAAACAVSAAALAHARGHVTAQRRGIVYKDADAFDAAARADVAVLCSRGTILLGEPEIVVVEAITKDGPSSKGWLRSPTPSLAMRLGESVEGAKDKSDIARVLAIAAGAEMSSTHPFASAIMREARARGVRPDNMRSALGHSGLGVTALAANGDRVIVGSRAFLLQEKVSVAIADARTSELEAEGRSVLLVAVGGRLVGLLALQDGLRPGARAAVQRLHDARIEPVLLSGEARDTCETIARALDIEHVRPEILPIDRGAEVRALADGGRIVAALGHASTDDGALGAADVSIAMEAAGSAPGEWGVAIASDDIRDAALALTVPRACRDRARMAVIVGGITHALGAFGIAFGIAPPAVVPVLGVLAAAAVVSIVREPTMGPG
jgi:Cu+-exporting ATPase